MTTTIFGTFLAAHMLYLRLLASEKRNEFLEAPNYFGWLQFPGIHGFDTISIPSGLNRVPYKSNAIDVVIFQRPPGSLTVQCTWRSSY